MMTLILILLAIWICLALSFFFSGSETAIISVNRFRLRSLHEQGDASAGRLLSMLENTQRLLVMVLIGTNLANVLTALFFKLFLVHAWPEWSTRLAVGQVHWAELMSLLILTPLMIVFAEILPKALFRARADRIIGGLRPVFIVATILMKPAIVITERFARLVLWPLSEQRTRAMRQMSRQDVINLITPDERPESEGEAPGAETAAADRSQPLGSAIAQEVRAEEESLTETSDERKMVHNIIELHDTHAYEIMTPLVNLVAIRLSQVDLDGLKRIAQQTGFSRFPVYRERIVNLIGHVDIFRVLREAEEGQAIEDFVEPSYFVPETKRVDDLLQEFLDHRIKNAIVVDEYGGSAGWISREDMLEEIVGEFEDELDVPQIQITEGPEGAFLVDGKTEIDLLNETLEANFADDDWETAAGLILNEMGRIPKAGEAITLGDWRVTVREIDANRIARLAFKRIK